MEFLVTAVSVVVFICLLLIIRLCAVVKTGPTRLPGGKGQVSVLVVAGSGNVNYTNGTSIPSTSKEISETKVDDEDIVELKFA